jgi:hypothetical protein
VVEKVYFSMRQAVKIPNRNLKEAYETLHFNTLLNGIPAPGSLCSSTNQAKSGCSSSNQGFHNQRQYRK